MRRNNAFGTSTVYRIRQVAETLRTLSASPELNAFLLTTFNSKVSFSCYRPTSSEVTFMKPALSHDRLSTSCPQEQKKSVSRSKITLNPNLSSFKFHRLSAKCGGLTDDKPCHVTRQTQRAGKHGHCFNENLIVAEKTFL